MKVAFQRKHLKLDSEKKIYRHTVYEILIPIYV